MVITDKTPLINANWYYVDMFNSQDDSDTIRVLAQYDATQDKFHVGGMDSGYSINAQPDSASSRSQCLTVRPRNYLQASTRKYTYSATGCPGTALN